MSGMWRRRSLKVSPAPAARFERLRRERELLRRAAGFFADGVAPGRPGPRLGHPAPRPR